VSGGGKKFTEGEKKFFAPPTMGGAIFLAAPPTVGGAFIFVLPMCWSPGGGGKEFSSFLVSYSFGVGEGGYCKWLRQVVHLYLLLFHFKTVIFFSDYSIGITNYIKLQ
jgi:hypothetical protein